MTVSQSKPTLKINPQLKYCYVFHFVSLIGALLFFSGGVYRLGI